MIINKNFTKQIRDEVNFDDSSKVTIFRAEKHSKIMSLASKYINKY